MRHKITLLFPGQGSQYLRMGKRLRDEFPPFGDILREAGDVLDFDLQSLIFDGTMEEITRSENAQPAIVAVSYAFFEYYTSTVGIEPDFLAGHSLGEISALLCSGAFSLRDAIAFTQMRGALMQEAFEKNLGHMGLVMGLESSRLDLEIPQLCSEDSYVAISAYNSQSQTLVSGDKKGIRALSARVEELGADYVPFRMVAMKVDAPYHCRLMEYAREPIRRHLEGVKLGALRRPVIANVTAKPYEQASDVIELLSSQLTSPVKWMQTLSFLKDSGVEIGVEIGPGQVLKNLVKEAGASFPVLSIDVPEEHAKIREVFCVGPKALAGKLEECLRLIAATKNRGLWDEEGFQSRVAKPYLHIERLLIAAEGDEGVSEDAVCEAIRSTAAAIEAKQPPHEEREAVLRELVPDLLLRNRKFDAIAQLIDAKTDEP